MDIRKWMQPKPKKDAEPKKRRIEDDDDDVIPESPDVQIISKRKKTNHDASKDKKKASKEKLKEVKIANLFDSGPIKRTEPIVKKDRKKSETGIHSDEEFEKSLLEIDGPDNLEPNDKKNHVDKQKDNKEDSDFKLEKNRHKNHDENDRISTKREDSVKPKTNGEHRSEKASHKHHNESTPSTSRDNTKTGNEIKKGIKETNKRKFSEIIEDETNGSNKNKYYEKSEKNKNIDVTRTETHEEDEDSANKKRKKSTTLNESVLTDEERYERKIQSARLYQSYLNRSGPKHLGAKEMPEGAPDCLKDFAFLLTGVLDSFERDEIVETVNKYGGCIKSGISKKVTHVLAGEDAGPAKMAKAQELGIKIITEDEFLQIIRDSNKQTKSDRKESIKDKNHSRKSSKDKDEKRKSSKDKNHDSASNSKDVEKIDVKKEISDHKDKNHDSERKKDKSEHKDNNKTEPLEHKSKRKTEGTDIKKEKSEHKHKSGDSEIKKDKSEHKDKNKIGGSENKREKSDHHKEKIISQDINHDKPSNSTKVDVVKLEKDLKSESESKSSMDIDKDESKSATGIKINDNNKNSSIMWVDKHKPQNVKQIIGQLGDNSNVNKLINWLTKWYVNRKAKLPKPSPWAKNDDGGYFKAALLSGPPGVGKTTTVALVCKQLGFDTVEFNASDTRNKTLIKGQIGELLTTNSLSAYAKGDSGKQAVTKKHVLVMDEVDGMAGNEDRGGLQELIGLIKSASVPIICMCNDRNSQKMRSLVNYCYDLRFARPRVDQIKAAMRSICCRENIKIPPDVLGQLIVAANQDVRQTLNLLSMWAIDPSRMDADRLSKDAAVTKKDIKLGPWEAIRKVFSAEDHKTMSINDKSDLFFYDYSLAPLFVQENYLQVQPHCPKHEVLQRVSEAADSISFGDLIDKRIRSSQAWSLLPMQAMYSSVLPGHYLSGHVGGQIQFPGWLGKNSRAGKMHRLCQEIHAHARLSTTGSKSSIFLDYASHLRDAIVTPLIKERTDGIEQSIQVLESYNLLREDLDSLVELSVWPGQRNPTVLIESKVKAAMTRAYNKKAAPLPYAPGAVKRARGRGEEAYGDEDAEDAADDAPDSDPEHDGLIKVQKKNSQQSESSSSSSDKPSTSKGKGKGSGKGKKK